MPLLGFERRFAAAVENGAAAAHRRKLPHPGVRAKRQTIRALRADGRDPKPGDTLHLYTGLRTSGVRKLGEVRCRDVERLRITRDGRVRLGKAFLEERQLQRLARADGFENAEAFVAFFASLHGLPLEAHRIRW